MSIVTSLPKDDRLNALLQIRRQRGQAPAVHSAVSNRNLVIVIANAELV